MESQSLGKENIIRDKRNLFRLKKVKLHWNLKYKKSF